MVVVAPMCTFYVAHKESNEYAALFLEEATAMEFIYRLAQSIGVPSSIFRNLYMIGPHGILIRVTDSVVQFTKPESVFQFTLRSSQHSPILPISQQELDNPEEMTRCDVILENTTPEHGVTNEVVHSDHSHSDHQNVNQQNIQGNLNQSRYEAIDKTNHHGHSHQQHNRSASGGIGGHISPYPRDSSGEVRGDGNSNSNGNHSSLTTSILNNSVVE